MPRLDLDAARAEATGGRDPIIATIQRIEVVMPAEPPASLLVAVEEIGDGSGPDAVKAILRCTRALVGDQFNNLLDAGLTAGDMQRLVRAYMGAVTLPPPQASADS
jgi:hypothetical protein